MEKKLYNILSFKKTYSSPPIWLMRQAGRYLPEYREIRSKVPSFLDLCYNPKLAAEVTMQPIKRFDFDAAIIFSDILVIADSLTGQVEFIEGKGPNLKIIENYGDLSNLKINFDCPKLNNTYQSLSLVKDQIAKDKTLIGFAGAPWTVAAYMLEGSSKNEFAQARLKCFNQRELVKNLIDTITELTIIYLKNQIKAGADVIQIFDSWSGILRDEEYIEFVITPTKKIIEEIKKDFPNTPIIGFPRNSSFLYEKYIRMTKVDGVSLDYNISLEQAKNLQNFLPIQGNLDPLTLFIKDKEIIKEKILRILDELSNKPFIFNLGHGIMPATPIENVELLIETIRGYKKR